MNKYVSPRQVDLRGAAAVVDARLEGWKGRGVEAETVLRLRASSIQENDVVGVTLRCGPLRGRVMAFGGGWVDFEFSIVDGAAANVLEIHPMTNEGSAHVVDELLTRLTVCFDEQMAENVAT